MLLQEDIAHYFSRPPRGHQCLEANSCQRMPTFQSQPLLTTVEAGSERLRHACPGQERWALSSPMHQGSCSGTLRSGCPSWARAIIPFAVVSMCFQSLNPYNSPETWVLIMITLFSHEETGSRTRREVAELGSEPKFGSGASTP